MFLLLIPLFNALCHQNYCSPSVFLPLQEKNGPFLHFTLGQSEKESVPHCFMQSGFIQDEQIRWRLVYDLCNDAIALNLEPTCLLPQQHLVIEGW